MVVVCLTFEKNVSDVFYSCVIIFYMNSTI